ncbi:MAG TPA: hypothetical protein ENO20_07755 [Bacteroides sp.]|nr:hypothetical protein [Bacteroides sp.]
MSRLVIFQIAFLTISLHGISQDGCSANSDVFVKRLNTDIYAITKIRNDGLILYSGFLKSKKPLIKSGIFSFYSSSGHLTAVGSYDNDILIGEWIYFDTKTDSYGKTLYGTPRIIDYDVVHTYMTKERLVKPIPVTSPEIPPTYNGGDYRAEFKKYINENLIYPAYPKYEGIEGQVLIQFRIDEKGEVREPSVFGSNHNDFSIEALRLIIEAPDWGPGIQNNKAVNEVINWTIDFNL